MMSQASVEEDGVSWIDDTGGPSCTENVSTMDSSNLTPAEVWFLADRLVQTTLGSKITIKKQGIKPKNEFCKFS